MEELGVEGAIRGETEVAAIAGKDPPTTDDLVNRNFYADRPDGLWVADSTYVSTWEGWCCSAFIVDVFARRIVGHAVSTRMNEALVGNASKTALRTRIFEGYFDLEEALHHNGEGSRYTAHAFTGLLAGHGIKASIGGVGDSCGSALAGSIDSSYKTEPTKGFGPWECFEQLRLGTAWWVHLFDTARISEHNGFKSPVDVEQLWYSEGIDARKRRKNVA